MTREEAYANKLISRSELINKIYDDFENRTCASCRLNTIHSTNRNGCMIIEISERDMRDNFCCNRYEKKDKQ